MFLSCSEILSLLNEQKYKNAILFIFYDLCNKCLCVKINVHVLLSRL